MSSISTKHWTKYQVLVGIFLLNFTNGITNIYGNFYPYIESYFRFRLPPDRSDLQPEWIFSTSLIFLSIGTLMADVLKLRIGLRYSVAVAIVIYFSGIFLSYVAVENSVWATTVTYGIMSMFGLGLLEVLSLCFTSGWFPLKQGLAGSFVVASGGMGAILINYSTSTYVNPDSLRPNFVQEQTASFSQTELLDRVPFLFVILGAIAVITQIPGCLLLKLPPDILLPDIELTVTKDKEIVDEKYYILSKTSPKPSSSSPPPLHSSSTENNKCDSACNSDNEDKSETVISMTLECKDDDSIGDADTEEKDKKDDICSNCSSTNNNNPHIPPKQMVKSRTFFALWFSLITQAFAIVVVSTYYKLFPQFWIRDDTFLTFVGSFSAVTGTFIRIIFGYLMDVFRVKSVLIAHTSLTAVSLAVWYFTPMLDRWVFFVVTNMLNGLTASVFIVYPMATLKLFGLTHFPTNCGIVMLGLAISDLGSPPLLAILASSFGWFGIFFTVGALMSLSVFIIIIFMPRTQVH